MEAALRSLLGMQNEHVLITILKVGLVWLTDKINAHRKPHQTCARIHMQCIL